MVRIVLTLLLLALCFYMGLHQPSATAQSVVTVTTHGFSQCCTVPPETE
jgi:hypothetical protein